MNEPRDCHTEWSKSDRKREISHDIHYMQNLKKKWYKWTYLPNRNRLIDLEKELIVTGTGVDSLELTCTHCYI